jgi:putative transposase
LIAKEQQFLSTINRKSSSKLKRLYVKRKKYQNNLFDNIISSSFKKMQKFDIQQIFIGDVKGIREQHNHSRNVNSMINNYWSYDILYHKLECKAEMLGITVNKITEEYTSKTCPNCLSVNSDNCQDRKFKCISCGYADDRDIVGARNILSKGMYGSIKNIHQDETVLLEVST